MPAGVSEHCSVVIQMIMFMMIVLVANIVTTMMAWNALSNVLVDCWCTFQVGQKGTFSKKVTLGAAIQLLEYQINGWRER